MPNELLPSNIGFGTVVGRFGSAPLIAGDADGLPDFSPATGLTVTFTPSTAAVIDATASPAPVTIEMVPIVCGLDSQGYLVGGDGQRGVKLIATDDTDINPSGWTYSVTFLRAGAKVAAFRDFSMSLPQGVTKDIALTIPVPSSSGVSLSQAQAAEAAAVAAASAASASALTATNAAASLTTTLPATVTAAVAAAPTVVAAFSTLSALLADTQTWAIGKRLSVTGLGSYQVASSGGDIVTAGGTQLAALLNESGRINVASVVRTADNGDIALALRRAAVRGAGSVFLGGGAYTLKTACNLGDLPNVDVLGSNSAAILITDDVTGIRMGPPVWEAIQTATPPAVDAYWTDRAIVGVTNASAYAVNDLVRLVSDDKAPSTRATPDDGTDYRIGQYAIVIAVNTETNTLTLDRPLCEDYSWTLNPRLGRLPRRRFKWSGGKIGYETGHESTGGTGGLGWHGQAMIMYGVSDVDIDVEIDHTYNSAINLVGCFGARVNVKGGDLLNNEYNQQYGYLVNDSSEYSEVHINAGRNRHGYTTNMAVVAANSASLHLYGETACSDVRGRSDGNSQAGFDFHHGSRDCVLHIPHSTGGTTGGGQLVVRGRGHRIINPVLQSGKDGIYIYSEVGVNSPTEGIEVVNPDVDVDRYPLQIIGSGTADRPIAIKGGRLRSRKYGQIGINVNSNVRFIDTVRIRPGNMAEIDSRRALNLYDSTVDATGATIIFDLRDVPAGATGYGLIQGDGVGAGTRAAALTEPTWVGGRIITLNDDAVSSAFYKKNLTASVPVFGGNGMVLETSKPGVNSKTTMDITGANGVGFAKPWLWRDLTGGGSTSYIERTVSVADYVLPWYNRSDDVVVARLFVSTTSRTLGALPLGTKVGQVLHLSVTVSAATLTLKHGSTYNTSLKGGVDLVFVAETGVSLVWTGARWVSTLSP